MTKDLERMLEILTEVSPEVGQAAREYLNTKEFGGFNCFVLKKPLFNELCDIEFKVLEKLEQEVDTKNYCTQLSRIFGFMGEIISSSYFYYLEKSGKYRVKHVPLLYFNYTDPLTPLEPIDQPNTIPILFNHAENNPSRFGVVFQSFLDHLDPDHFYDTILFASITPELKQIFSQMASQRQNLSLRFVDSAAYKASLYDRFGLKNDNGYKNFEDLLDHLSAYPFLPFILSKYQKMLVFDENNLFCDSIVPLWEQGIKTQQLLLAPPNAYILSRINDVYFETAERYLRTQLKNPFNYFSINAVVWDFEQYRQSFTEKQIAKLYPAPEEPKALRHKEEIMNVLCEERVEPVDIRWNTWFETNDHLKYQLPYAPHQLYADLQIAQKSPVIISYVNNDPWDPGTTPLSMQFWSVARRTPFYEEYLDYGTLLMIERAKHHRTPLLIKLFPVGGAVRGKLTKLFPYDSKRSKAVKKFLGALHIR